jgi:hypothetical protein
MQGVPAIGVDLCARRDRMNGPGRRTTVFFLPSTEDLDDLMADLECRCGLGFRTHCLLAAGARTRLFRRSRCFAAATMLTAEEFEIAEVDQQPRRLPGDINGIFAVERIDEQ